MIRDTRGIETYIFMVIYGLYGYDHDLDVSSPLYSLCSVRNWWIIHLIFPSPLDVQYVHDCHDAASPEGCTWWIWGRSQTSLKMMERPGTSCHQLEKIKFTGMRWTSAACSSVSHCSLNCMIIWSTCRFMNVMNVMDVIFLTLWMFANVLLDDWDI